MPEIPAVIDGYGPIRYDWPRLKLLYVGGASNTDIARSITTDFPEHFERVRAAINQRSCREEWPKLREESVTLVNSRSGLSKNNDSPLQPPSSQNVITTAANTASVRKNRYLEITSKFIDRAASQLESHPVESLADAALAAKFMLPVHEIAKDVHGLNGKDGSNQVQVNILSDWAGSGPPEIQVETHQTSDETKA
jgi:hypothetical protein